MAQPRHAYRDEMAARIAAWRKAGYTVCLSCARGRAVELSLRAEGSIVLRYLQCDRCGARWTAVYAIKYVEADGHAYSAGTGKHFGKTGGGE